MGKIICRFCFKTCEHFQAVEIHTSDILDMLQLKLNLAVSEEPVMCTNCVESLMNSFEFKAMCTHNYATSFLDNVVNVKLDLNKVYLSKNESVSHIPEDQTVCGFCMDLVKKVSVISLVYENGNVMLEKCLPELDFSIIDAPMICGPCQASLQNCFHFMKDCLIVEEKIEKYCEAEGVNSEGLIELTDVQEYISRNMLKMEDTLDIVKRYKTFCEYGENTVDTLICKEERNEADTEGTIYMETDIKIEPKNENFEEPGDPEFINVNESLIATSELEDKKCLIVEEIEIKTVQNDFDSLQGEDSSPQLGISNQLHSCCGLLPEQCQCESRLYQTKHKTNVEAKYKSGVLSRKNASEIEMSQCDSCDFKTKYKHCLCRHMLIHKDPSEVTMHKCDICSYKTIRKRCLHVHMLNHKDPSEVTMHKCSFCSFQSRHKWNLQSHMIIHKLPHERKMYQCESCAYKTVYKNALHAHALIHKDRSEVTMYQCDFCSYKTIRKRCLHVHMLNHKDPSEVTMHKCSFCSFQSRHKWNLQSHMIIHKLPHERKMYQCESCAYKTAYNSALHIHALIHKDCSEVTMYQCGFCSYQTKRKGNLQKHMSTDKHSSETAIAIHQCEFCLFKTKSKYHLRKHMLMSHKNPSKMTVPVRVGNYNGGP